MRCGNVLMIKKTNISFQMHYSHGKDSHSNSFVTPRTALQGIITSSEVMKTVEPLRKQPRLIVAAMVQ